MIEQVKAVERAVLAVAVTVLPGLVALGWVPADAATTVGAVLSSLSAGLRLPDAAAKISRPRKRHRPPVGVSEADHWTQQFLAAAANGRDYTPAAELEAMIGQAAERIVTQLRAREQAPDPNHGERPSS